jgi:hypothetical protein
MWLSGAPLTRAEVYVNFKNLEKSAPEDRISLETVW